MKDINNEINNYKNKLLIYNFIMARSRSLSCSSENGINLYISDIKNKMEKIKC